MSLSVERTHDHGSDARILQYTKGYGYVDAGAAREAALAALANGDLESARVLCHCAQLLCESTVRSSLRQIQQLEESASKTMRAEDSLGAAAELRFDCALLQLLQDHGYIDYGKSIVAASHAHQRNDPAVATLFYRYARAFLEESLDEALGRSARLAMRIDGCAHSAGC